MVNLKQTIDRPAKPGSQAAVSQFMRNLLNDVQTLASFYMQELDRGSWVNAFLLSAGINQIVEDYLHLDPFYLRKASIVLARDAPAAIAPLSIVFKAASVIANFFFSHQPHVHQMRHWQREWALLVQDLAEASLSETVTSKDASQIGSRSEELIATLNHFPKNFLRVVLHIPSSFRGFDQTPEDFQNLVEKFSSQHPNRNRKLVIVGIRTSGSYLAPLCRTYLMQLGYTNVSVFTLRPGSLLLPSEKSFIQNAIQENALFIVVDDPPASGQSYLKSAQALERAGIPHDAIILMFMLFHNQIGFPECLKAYASVVFPWEEWTIHKKLDPLAVGTVLASFLKPGDQIIEIERQTSLPQNIERGHISALYRMKRLDSRTNTILDEQVFVKGVGYAYFGEHSLAVSQELTQYFPQIYGLCDGLLYRKWVSEDDRLLFKVEGKEQAAANTIVDYVVSRNQKLSVPHDLSVRLLNEGPAWEVASNVVSQVFGRAWWIARIPIVDPLIRRILKTNHPSIIDGNMSPSHWFITSSQNQMVKTAFDEGVFRNDIEFTCYDPAFDLASLAADLDLADLNGMVWARKLFQLLRPQYKASSGEDIGEERWLIYQFVRLWDLQRERVGQAYNRVQRASARALQRYFSAVFFKGLCRPSSGLICAIDLDGVLESNYLGFPGLSPASATALRALVRHGYQPVLATGRSLPEVMERCSTYPLSGGVAEYGAVIFNPVTGQVQNLLTENDQKILGHLREALGAIEGVFLDSDYRFAVRAFRMSKSGRRKGLEPGEVAAALASIKQSEMIRPIFGDAQTDFMVTHIDKKVGLRAMVHEIKPDMPLDEEMPLALAVGDTISDLPMFEIAKLACVPAHSPLVTGQTRIKRMKEPYQAGLKLAVGELIGHRPGSCRLCANPPVKGDTKRLMTLFSAQESGWKSMLRSSLLLFGEAVWTLSTRSRSAPRRRTAMKH